MNALFSIECFRTNIGLIFWNNVFNNSYKELRICIQIKFLKKEINEMK